MPHLATCKRATANVVRGAAVLAALLFATIVSAQTLTLESVEISGNARTNEQTVLAYLGLQPGDALDSDRILDGIDALRDSELFETVAFRTRAGSERGRVILALDVVERGFEFRFGTGYRDLDGWYLIPAQLRADNRLGRGEQLRLQAKIGYRVAGIEFIFGERALPTRPFDWGIKFASEELDRPYFIDGIEYRHRIVRGELGAHLGRRVSDRWRLEVGARFQEVELDSVPTARVGDDVQGIAQGDALPFEDLPSEIAAVSGDRRQRTILHTDLVHDSRAAREIAATPVSGLWGRLRAEAFVADASTVGSLTADVRAYRKLAGGALAFRARGGFIGDDAPFIDRFHLGGLYTIRGFPSQSLSPPEGDTAYWSTSLEYRAALVGRTHDPRLAGVVFVDAGDGFVSGDTGSQELAASAGFGLRLRVPWFHSLGIDFGMPISESPVGEAFHGNASIGWNF